MSLYGTTFLTRPQLDAISATTTNPVLEISKILYEERASRMTKIPAISLSVLDNFIWLNECHNLGIPSIQICDTQSYYDLITYPIIANQRSIPFTYLLVHLFSEACNFSVMSEHLHFLNYSRFAKNFIFKKALRHVRKRRRNKLKIINKKTFIVNTRSFSYLIRDFILNPSTVRTITHHENIFYYVAKFLCLILTKIRRANDLLYRYKKQLPYHLYRYRYKQRHIRIKELFAYLKKACLHRSFYFGKKGKQLYQQAYLSKHMKFSAIWFVAVNLVDFNKIPLLKKSPIKPTLFNRGLLLRSYMHKLSKKKRNYYNSRSSDLFRKFRTSISVNWSSLR
jgi:hypothetical protein